MKRYLSIVVSLVLFVAPFILMVGCGQQQATTSSTTTTLAPGTKAGETTYDAIKAVTGVSEISSTIGLIASSVSSNPIIFDVPPPPPAAFFSPIPADGWITPEVADLPSGESIQIRFYTKGGKLVNADYLAGKKIASLEGFDWQTLASGSPSIEALIIPVCGWLTNEVRWDDNPARQADFYASPKKYRSLSSLWDYIFWSIIAPNPSMEAAIDWAWRLYPTLQSPPGLPRSSYLGGFYPSLGTPEASEEDQFGSQEARVRGTHPDGSVINMTQTVSTDANGMPISATGSGTITRSDGVVMTFTITMNFENARPAGGTMDITVGAPDNLHIVMTLYASGSAEGTVYSTASGTDVEIGRVVIFASPDSSGNTGYFEDKATGNKEYFKP